VTRAYLGLGSNLGERERFLADAIGTLGGSVTAVSDVYETEPVGGPDGQGPFLNLVVELDTDLDPHELLAVCRRLESAAERVREVRWGPRTLDVDVLWIDGVALDDPELTVPHPRMRERRFVLAPLSEIAPDLVDPEDLRLSAGTVERIGRLGDLTG
jgi:2-amino-4-hydroxy-6-hydroxymethyldihydropteridine diphosphokinase